MIYVASKAKHGQMWLDLKEKYQLPIKASWLNVYKEGMIEDYAAHWMTCISEVSSSRAVMLYHKQGEVQKGALVEVGAAILAGVPVFVFGDVIHDELGSWLNHPSVCRCSSVEVAVSMVRRV